MASDPTITEAEIEAALDEWYGPQWRSYVNPKTYPIPAMRAALLAAAQVRPADERDACIEQLREFNRKASARAEQAEEQIPWLLKEISEKEAERETLALEYLRAGAQLTSVSVAIGSNRWLDPPDGGDVSLAEQVSRMREALEKAEAERDAARADAFRVEAERDALRLAQDRIVKERDFLNTYLRGQIRAGLSANDKLEADNDTLRDRVEALTAALIWIELSAKPDHPAPGMLIDSLKRLATVALAGKPAACTHEWMIWPETDGQEQKCVKCGSYRSTAPVEPSSTPLREMAWNVALELERTIGFDRHHEWPSALLAALTAAEARGAERERTRIAEMIEAHAKELQPGPAKLALAITVMNIRRGRRLTATEQMNNLEAAIRGGDRG